MSDVEPRSLQTLIPATTPASSGSSSARTPKAWTNGDRVSFRDVLAVVNPLQHIPVVGTIYRAITGVTIAAMPSIIGGALFGGPVGFVLSLADNAVKAETGKSVGETVVAGLFGGSARKTAESLVAKAEPAPSPPPKLVIDIPAPRRGENIPQPFADGKPPVVINLPQPKWALEASGVQQQPAAGNLSAAAFPVPSLPTGTSPPLNARFRSTDLPPPQVEGGVQTHSGADLVPTPVGTPVTRDAVPNAMASALDKYAAVMRTRQAQLPPTQVSVLL